MNSAGLESAILAYPDGRRNIMFAYPCSVVELPDGRLFCTFHGRPQEHQLGGCYACFSDDDGRTWSEPQLLIGRDGENVHADPNVVIDGGRVMVFSTSYRYKTEKRSDQCGSWTPDLTRYRTWKMVSEDSGRTWSKPVEMPKSHAAVGGMTHIGLKLADGTLVMGYAWDKVAERGLDPRTESGTRCCAGVLRSRDGGETWTPGGDLEVNPEDGPPGANEPALVLLADGSLYALVRTATDHLWESRSRDGGLTWDPARPSPFVGHNCPAELMKLQGEPETVMVVFDNHPEYRTNLCAAYSTDGCRTWSRPKVIDPGPEGGHAGYPAACHTSKGTIVLAWYRADDPEGMYHIRCARFTAEWLTAGSDTSDEPAV